MLVVKKEKIGGIPFKNLNIGDVFIDPTSDQAWMKISAYPSDFNVHCNAVCLDECFLGHLCLCKQDYLVYPVEATLIVKKEG
jgi:hypothetical protein